MKILIVTVLPFSYSSVERLAEMIKKHNEHLDIQIFPFHGKRYSQNDLIMFERIAKDKDLIDFEYWRGADVLIKQFPWLKEKKKILAHHNPYDLHKIAPNLFDAVLVDNKTQQSELPGSIHIPLAVDLDFFEFKEDYTKEKVVGMVAFRIEGKKGIREVARASKELGYRFILVGKISKPDYFRQIMKVNPETEFREEVSDEELRQAYYEMGVLACNSLDNFESGPMPPLEAMSCGTPVLTRNVGSMRDIDNGENMLVRDGKTDDVEDLKCALRGLMEDRERRLRMRERGWQTVKNWGDKRMAIRYAETYNRVLFPSCPLVSVITPTYNRKEQVLEIIDALKKQIYPNIELVVCDDGSTDGTESAIKGMREQTRYPIKYINTVGARQIKMHEYGLAMARNLGVIEAEGEILMFLDSRFVPEPNAIEEFTRVLESDKVWLFGDKGAGKRSFVENFSMIKKRAFVLAGMCNERITRYGGMSQELRTRFSSQGFEFVYVPKAKAKEIRTAQKLSTKRKSIIEMKDLLYKLNL